MSTSAGSSTGSSLRPNRFTRNPPRPPIPSDEGRPSQPVPRLHIPERQPPRQPQPPLPPAAIASSSTSPPPPIPVPVPLSPLQETLSTLLTSIATSLSSSLSLLSSCDQTQWTADEFSQLSALDSVLSFSAADYAELSQLVGGPEGMYWANDTDDATLAELRDLVARFESLREGFEAWNRMGGPVDPTWAKETEELGRELRRAVRRGAERVWRTRAGEGSGRRCLGGERVGRLWRRGRGETGAEEGGNVRWKTNGKGKDREGDRRRGSLELAVPECNAVGRFERLGDEDVAFVCDYCDGFLVWENLAEVPSERARAGSTTPEGYPNWAASGRKHRVEDVQEDERKTVVFAPLAIASHLPPRHGEWMSRIVCPFCEEYTYIDAGDDGGGERKWTPEQDGFESVRAFEEHLAWTHTALPRPKVAALAGDGKCEVM